MRGRDLDSLPETDGELPYGYVAHTKFIRSYPRAMSDVIIALVERWKATAQFVAIAVRT